MTFSALKTSIWTFPANQRVAHELLQRHGRSDVVEAVRRVQRVVLLMTNDGRSKVPDRTSTVRDRARLGIFDDERIHDAFAR